MSGIGTKESGSNQGLLETMETTTQTDAMSLYSSGNLSCFEVKYRSYATALKDTKKVSDIEAVHAIIDSIKKIALNSSKASEEILKLIAPSLKESLDERMKDFKLPEKDEVVKRYGEKCWVQIKILTNIYREALARDKTGSALPSVFAEHKSKHKEERIQRRMSKNLTEYRNIGFGLDYDEDYDEDHIFSFPKLPLSSLQSRRLMAYNSAQAAIASKDEVAVSHKKEENFATTVMKVGMVAPTNFISIVKVKSKLTQVPLPK